MTPVEEMVETIKAARWIVINSSAGKDSQASLDFVVRFADEQNIPRRRLVVAHADLGRMEWDGTVELAELQAKHYGLRFIKVRRQTKAGANQTLLEQVAERGMWPSSTARYCTSDHKRDPISRIFTQLQREAGQGCTIINVLGMRADESPARSKLVPWSLDARATSGKRTVYRWLPIHGWTVDRVWRAIVASGVPHHHAYDLGMPRLSCRFCIFAPRAVLILSGRLNRPLLQEYVDLENKMGHTFRKDLSLASVAKAVDAGEDPGPVRDWIM